MKFVSIDDVKLFLGITSAIADNLLEVIVKLVSGRIEKYLDVWIEKKEYEESFKITSQKFWVRALPVKKIFEIKVDDTIIPISEYDIEKDIGLITISRMIHNNRVINIRYEGGYETDKYDIILVPEDIKYATLLQSAYLFQRKATLGLSAVGGATGSINILAFDFLPDVRRILDSNRRIIF